MPEINLDLSGVNDEVVPEGWHTARIFNIESVTSENGNAMLKVQSKIEGGPYNGRSLFDNWMLETDAVFRTKQVLVRLGLMAKEDKTITFKTEDLIGKEVEVKVKHQEYEGQMQPRPRGYRLPTGNTLESASA